MYVRWAVLALGVTGGILMLWGLLMLPVPVALLIAGTLLCTAAVLLHLRSSPSLSSQPHPPPAMAVLLSLMRRRATGAHEPAEGGGKEAPGAPDGEEPPADPAVSAGAPAVEGQAAAPGVQEPAAERGAPLERSRPVRPGRPPMVRATATTYQGSGETATHRVRVRISGRRSP